MTHTSYELVKETPGMYRWTIRAGIQGAIIGVIGGGIGMFLVFLGEAMIDPEAPAKANPLGYVPLVLGALIALLGAVGGLTAANRQLAGLVMVTDDVLHGRPVDESAAKEAAHSRLGALAAWSAISVAVGALVSAIQGDGDSGIVVSIVRSLLAGLVAAVWAVVTTLVMPLIVLEHLGAVSAIKRSASIIRSTWGEALAGGVRIGARFMLLYTLPGALLVVGGIVLVVALDGPSKGVGGIIALVGVVLMVVGLVKAATCKSVFGVALYRWAAGEGALGPFSEDDLRNAVRVSGSKVPVG
ncbi:MAG: DUF6159 family protein [Microthrixaceae bacterium]